MEAIVIGATGATGKDLVNQLLEDSDYEKVKLLVRRKVSWQHSKLEVHVIDFNFLSTWKDLVKADIAFSCIGTTLKNAQSKDAQKVIDLEYPLSFAKAAKENGIRHFVLLSAYGANPKSFLFYSKIKGELEEEIRNLNFPQTTIFRPGIIERKNSDRLGEKWTVYLLHQLNKINLLKKYKPLPTHILAKAMKDAGKRNTTGCQIISLEEIDKYQKPY